MAHATAQMQWLPRDTGSAGWVACGDYIAGQLAAYGWAVEDQRFPYQDVPNCRNIIGRRGSGPAILIGAHYDTRREADRDPDPARRLDPVPGANDGASGIAVLLELARVLRPEELGYTIWLAAFDAEDNGNLVNKSDPAQQWDWIAGSTYMAQNLATPLQAVIVVDMIGDAEQQMYFEGSSDETLTASIWDVGRQLGYNSFISGRKYSLIDDHRPFAQRGIPAVDIIDFDYPDEAGAVAGGADRQFHHTTQDTIDKISAASLEAVGRTLVEWLRRGTPGLSLNRSMLQPVLAWQQGTCACARRG